MKLFFACFLGLLAIIPSFILQVLLPKFQFSHPLWLLLHAIFVTGLIEEGSKALAFWFFPIKFLGRKNSLRENDLEDGDLREANFRKVNLKEVDLKKGEKNSKRFFKTQAGALVFYAFFLGLSFGLYELIVYFISGVGFLSLRFFTTVIFHALCAVLDAFFIVSWKKKKLWLSPFIFSVLMHGLYNFFASFTGFIWWFSIFVLVLTFLQMIYVYKACSEKEVWC